MSSQSGFVPMVFVPNGHVAQSSRPSQTSSSQGTVHRNGGRDMAHSTVRPPTFDEALHLTPLSSIVPFSHRKL
jgi:hypothetical protein